MTVLNGARWSVAKPGCRLVAAMMPTTPAATRA